MSARKKLVHDYFEETSNYLGGSEKLFGVQLRSVIISKMIDDNYIGNLLDAPCGNGLISLPLLSRSNTATLVDISDEMIKLARRNLEGEESFYKVKLVNEDLLKVDLPAHAYDTVLAVGILAHIDEPQQFFKRISELVKPGGILVVQNTDADHIKSRLLRIIKGKNFNWQKFYKLNSISHSWMLEVAAKFGFEVMTVYRYETNIPWIKKKGNYEKIQKVMNYFGTPPNNKWSFLGNKCIYKFKKL